MTLDARSDEDGPIPALRERGRARRRGEGPVDPSARRDAPVRASGEVLAPAAWDGAMARLEAEVAQWGRRLTQVLERRAEGAAPAAPGDIEDLLADRDAIELLAWEIARDLVGGDSRRRIRLGRLRVALAALDEEILAHPNAFLAAAPTLARGRSDFRLGAADRDRFWWWYEIPAWASDPAALGAARRRALQRRLVPPGALPLTADRPKGASGEGSPERPRPHA